MTRSQHRDLRIIHRTVRSAPAEQSEGAEGKRSDEEGPERAKENELAELVLRRRGPTPATHLHILRVITTKKF